MTCRGSFAKLSLVFAFFFLSALFSLWKAKIGLYFDKIARREAGAGEQDSQELVSLTKSGAREAGGLRAWESFASKRATFDPQIG